MYILLALFILASTALTHAVAAYLARRAVTSHFTRAAPGAPDATTRGPVALSLGAALLRGAAGLVAWYLTSSLIITGALLGRGETVVDEVSMRVTVAADGPAARAGIRDGDRIVSVGGDVITSWEALKRTVAKHGGESVAVVIERGGAEQTLDVTVPAEPPKILVGPHSETRSIPLGRAIGQGLSKPGEIVHLHGRGLYRLFASKEKPELAGPVGITRETSSAAKQGVGTGLLLAAMLASYCLPYIFIATLLHEILTRRRKPAAP